MNSRGKLWCTLCLVLFVVTSFAAQLLSEMTAAFCCEWKMMSTEGRVLKAPLVAGNDAVCQAHHTETLSCPFSGFVVLAIAVLSWIIVSHSVINEESHAGVCWYMLWCVVLYAPSTWTFQEIVHLKRHTWQSKTTIFMVSQKKNHRCVWGLEE